nr:hypothetical protein [Tanacetum cinerariifolium]
MKEFAANDQANYYLGFTSFKANEKNAYELKGKFLDELHKNAFSRTNREDAIKHIEYFLRIVNPIGLPNVNQGNLSSQSHRLEMHGNGSDDTELTNEKGSDLEDECSSDVDVIAKIFKMKDNLLDYETPLQIKTYEEYELDNNMTGELEEPWLENGIPYKMCDHICEPYRFRNEMTKWPTCSSNIDGFCNGGELPKMV